MLPRVELMQGNEACAEGALAAGVNFFAGYPITPSTEIAEILAQKLPQNNGCFVQMEDEIGSIAACIGAAIGGAKAITATSGPGFSLMQENIGYAAMAEIPCVIVNVQRWGPSTGMPTSPSQGDVMQARWGTHGDHPVIVLSPASVKEAFTLTTKAVAFSERFRTPVVLLMDEVIGHLREKVVFSNPNQSFRVDRRKPQPGQEDYKPYSLTDEVSPLAAFGDGYLYHITGLAHDEYGFPSNDKGNAELLLKRIHAKIENHRQEITITEKIGEDARLWLITYGCTARPAARAVKQARKSGMDVAMLRTACIWPFPEVALKQVAKQADYLLVPEMNMGQLVKEVERLVGGQVEVIPYNRFDGELFSPEEIYTQITKVVA